MNSPPLLTNVRKTCSASRISVCLGSSSSSKIAKSSKISGCLAASPSWPSTRSQEKVRPDSKLAAQWKVLLLLLLLLLLL
eukprot:CAMPEP_0194775106 /NCGR_PEP_ID=MMETSP0323_2-20130528/59451_1 /TAXON_ID=2866 ORGANISM="Crypthecodinium cohnii, Strain Seligo" /NCGR_SAMPLE_ID=MMETSP0323_2 /ASSEMBLY_ACC=CAM_ASM_000346 /LENGTH=79 /DNA_ID=CAMNT_0039710953 /DNA_START=45 /DNA_END=281 /DNA_ORIENTATION=-